MECKAHRVTNAVSATRLDSHACELRLPMDWEGDYPHG